MTIKQALIVFFLVLVPLSGVSAATSAPASLKNDIWDWKLITANDDKVGNVVDVVTGKNGTLVVLRNLITGEGNRESIIERYSKNKKIQAIKFPAKTYSAYYQLFERRDGNIYVYNHKNNIMSQSNANLLMYEDASKTWKTYQDDKNDFSNIYYVNENKAGVWFVTNKILTNYNYKTWTTNLSSISGADGVSEIKFNDKYAVLRDKTSIYLLGPKDKNFTKHLGLSQYKGNILLDKNNNLWIYQNDYNWSDAVGLIKYNLDTNKLEKFTTKNGLVANGIDSMATDSKGNVYAVFGTESFNQANKYFYGLAKYDGKTWKKYDKLATGMEAKNIKKLIVDQANNLYAIISGRGLYQITLLK